MSQLSEDDQSSWDSMLPEIFLAINSSISDSTGYTPAFLTQGRETQNLRPQSILPAWPRPKGPARWIFRL